jgi:hypothetical protein
MCVLSQVRADTPHWPGQGMQRGDLWLTEAETREVLSRVNDIVEGYGKGRTPQQHPKGARKLTYVWSLIPND